MLVQHFMRRSWAASVPSFGAQRGRSTAASGARCFLTSFGHEITFGSGFGLLPCWWTFCTWSLVTWMATEMPWCPWSHLHMAAFCPCCDAWVPVPGCDMHECLHPALRGVFHVVLSCLLLSFNPAQMGGLSAHSLFVPKALNEECTVTENVLFITEANPMSTKSAYPERAVPWAAARGAL